MGNEVNFLPVDKHKSFLQDDTTLWLCASRHVQSIQNNKFAIYLKYLKENVKSEVDFLPADKRQKFLHY